MKILLCVVVVIFVLVALVIAFLFLAPQLGAKSSGKYLEIIKKSPEYDGERFQNTPPTIVHIGFLEGFKVMGEILWGEGSKRPEEALPSKQVLFDQHTGNYLTWFGHSTFLYEVDGKKILFDPMLEKYASPIPGLIPRFDYTLPSSAEELPYLDAVIISHDHYDHLDYKTVQTLKEKVGVFIMPLGVGAHLRRWGVAEEKIIELDWHSATHIGEGEETITITSVPSQHFSGRSLNDVQATLWSAFIVQNKNAKVFFGGDSGYFSGFKTIGDQYGPFDLTLIDSGQYNERWSSAHMFPEQSVQAHKDLRGNVYMPIHWSGFSLSTHPWKDPAERALIAATKEGVAMISPIIGQRFNVLTDQPTETWWRELE